MTCPISHAELVSFWARDVDETTAERIEEHLFECEKCFARASAVAAMADAVRHAVAPVVVDRDVELARARGLVVVSNDLYPGQAVETRLAADTDLLVHRLRADLHDVERIDIELAAPDGTPVLQFADAPFERDADSVLIACRRHFVDLLPDDALDLDIVVRFTREGGETTSDTYTALHRLDA